MRGLLSPGKGVSCPGKGLSSPGKGLSSPGKGLSSAGKGLSSPGKGLSSPDNVTNSKKRFVADLGVLGALEALGLLGLQLLPLLRALGRPLRLLLARRLRRFQRLHLRDALLISVPNSEGVLQDSMLWPAQKLSKPDVPLPFTCGTHCSLVCPILKGCYGTTGLHVMACPISRILKT